MIIDPCDFKKLADTAIPSFDTLYICADKTLQSGSIPDISVIAVDADLSMERLFNDLQEIYNLFDEWDEAMKTVCYEGGSFSDLIACCEPVICDPVSLFDKSFHYAGYSKLSEERGLMVFVDENNRVPLDIVNDFVTGNGFPKLYECREAFAYPFTLGDVLCKNIFYNDEFVGRLHVQPNDFAEPRVKYSMALLDYLSVYAEKMYGMYRSFNLKEIALNSLCGLLVDCLSKKEISDGKWEKAFQNNGWNGNDSMLLVQFRPNLRYDKNLYAKYFSSEIIRKWQGCACFEYESKLLLLVNLARFSSVANQNFYQSLAYFVRESLLVAGLSREFTDMSLLHSALVQTDIALDIGAKLTPTLWYFKFDDYALSYLLSTCTGPFEGEQLCSKALLTLREHDLKKNTDYYKTLRTYFDCRFNAAATAKLLFLHRSSFLNRMERIKELVSIDFESNDEILYLSLSFRLLEME